MEGNGLIYQWITATSTYSTSSPRESRNRRSPCESPPDTSNRSFFSQARNKNAHATIPQIPLNPSEIYVTLGTAQTGRQELHLLRG